MLPNNSILTANRAGDLFHTNQDLTTKTKLNSPLFQNIRFISTGLDSNTAFLTSDDFCSYLYDIEKQTVSNQLVLEGHLGIITSVDCLYQKPGLLTASLDGTVRFWDTRTGEAQILLENAQSEIWAVKYYEAIDKVVVGDENGDLSVLQIK